MIERDDIEGLAAEYVLGTLDKSERSEVDASRQSDPLLLAAIEAWEGRLAPLQGLTAPASPSENLFPLIERRIVQLEAGGKPRLSTKPPWQILALAASVLLLFIAGALVRQQGLHIQRTAELSKPGASAMFLVRFDGESDDLSVSAMVAPAAADKDYELWLIPQGEKKPKPLGIISNPSKVIHLSSQELAKEVSFGTLAISLEPKGGSTEEGPSGPVLVTGKFDGEAL